MDQVNTIEEISLRELIETLLKRKKMIAVITVISILISGILSFLIIKPTYESNMVLMASDASGKITNQGFDGSVDQMLDSISQYPSMNIETYRQQVKTPEVLSKTIHDLNLEDEYSVQSLGGSVTLETIKDTPLITIKVTNNNPQKAAEIANKIGENFINFVTSNAKERASSTSTYLAAQMDIEKSKFDESLLEQKEMLSEPRGASELSLELQALLGQVTQFKTELNDLDIRKEALMASIDTAEDIPSNGSSIILNQNTGNISIDKIEKTLKIELAEVESKIISITQKIKELQNQIEKLQIEYQDKSHKESLTEQKVNIAKNTYESFVKKYEELRVTESAEIGEVSVTIISRAYPSTNPVAPRKALNVAIATVLGVMVGVFAAFFIEYWQVTDSKVKINSTDDKE